MNPIGRVKKVITQISAQLRRSGEREGTKIKD
jgi:hypothetical protein